VGAAEWDKSLESTLASNESSEESASKVEGGIPAFNRADVLDPLRDDFDVRNREALTADALGDFAGREEG
jgi:hypothetical protein